MKKHSLVFALATSSLLLTLSPAFAATSTSSASDTKSASSSSSTENIQELIKKKATENQVKGISTDTQKKRGFIATVKRVSEEALTVDTRKATEIITLSPDVSIVQDGKAFKVSNIEIDSQVAIMGYQNGEDFTPKRILVLKKPLQGTKKSVWIGSIKKMDKIVSGNFVAFTIQTRANEEKTFSLTGKPIIEDDKGNILKVSELQTDQNVLIITIPEDPTKELAKDSSGVIVHIRSLASTDSQPADSNEPTPTGSKSKTTATPTAKVTGKPTTTPKASPTKKPTATPTE